jgi:hypothetical protein
MANTLFLKSAIWCIKVYDDFWAPKLRKAPDIIHELATQGRGITPLSAPSPLPRNRKRALTNPLMEIDLDHGLSYSIRRSRQRNDLQVASLFIKIRNLIYSEVLAGGEDRLVHVLSKDGRLGHWRCRLQGGKQPCASQTRRCIEGWLSYRDAQWNMDHNGMLDPKTDSGLMPLLLTCRIMLVLMIYPISGTDHGVDIPRLLASCIRETSFTSMIQEISATFLVPLYLRESMPFNHLS